MIDLVAEGDLDAPVPPCPGWTLTDLASHIGGVHRWAAATIRTGAPGERVLGPSARVDLVEWMTEGLADLLTLLASADLTAPAWTFGPEPRLVSFWPRRQAQETSVHLWDGALSQGQTHLIDPRLAADGIDEVLTVFIPRQIKREHLAPLTGGVLLVLSDCDDESFVLAGQGSDPEAATQAMVRGTAQELLLALWRRQSIDTLDIAGDVDLARGVFASALTS
jgi:uncharacterized protein (TIGR03083 family)